MGVKDNIKARLASWRRPAKTKAPAPALPANTNRADAWSSSISGLGYSAYDPSASTLYRTTEVTQRPDVIRRLMRSNAIARKVVSKQVHLAYGTGVDYTATGGLDGAGDVFKDELRRLELESKVKQARTLGRAFGGALLIMSIDDGLNPSEPLDLSKVRQLLYLRAVDRWSVTRTEYDLTGGPRDGEPTVYTVTSASGSAVRIHHTRCIRFEGLETDSQTRAGLGGWSDSVLQLVYDEIRDIDAGGQSLSVQLQSAVQTVFKIKNLHEQILASNREFVENWIQSVEMFRSNFRAIGLDADNESIEFLSRPLADSVKVYEQLQTRVAAATSMPVSELFGQAPAGLSTDDLSGTRRFYDTIESEEQRGAQGQALESILRVLAAQSATPAIQGATLGFVWPSLYSPTSKEKAELDKIKAETVAILNETGDLQAGDYRDAAAAMLGLDLHVEEDPLDALPVDPSATIADPVERIQQARLAIGSGLLHLPDVAQAFRPLFGLGPLEDGDVRAWFDLIKTSNMESDALDTSDIAPVAVGDSYGPLLVSRLSKLFAQQAARLARGQSQISYGKVKQHVLRATRGLPSGDQAKLQAYFKEQWEALPGDVATFKAVREARGEEPQPADIIALVKTRTRLRTKHLGNRLDQAHNRADMSKAGSTSFVWTTRGDSVVRPEHKALDGQVFPLASGAPTVGFPGDPPGCRCVARPVPNSAALGETQ